MTFRFAQEADCSLILSFIRQLAAYEKMSDQVVATEELLREWIFEKQKAEVLFVCEEDREVGFALFLITSPRSWDAQASIWRICLSCRSPGTRDMAGRCSGSWRRSPLSGDAADWSGRAWTGISRASISIFLSVLFRWMTGQPTD